MPHLQVDIPLRQRWPAAAAALIAEYCRCTHELRGFLAEGFSILQLLELAIPRNLEELSNPQFTDESVTFDFSVDPDCEDTVDISLGEATGMQVRTRAKWREMIYRNGRPPPISCLESTQNALAGLDPQTETVRVEVIERAQVALLTNVEGLDPSSWVESIQIHSSASGRARSLLIWFTGTGHYVTSENEILRLNFVSDDDSVIVALRTLLGWRSNLRTFHGSLHGATVSCESAIG